MVFLQELEGGWATAANRVKSEIAGGAFSRRKFSQNRCLFTGRVYRGDILLCQVELGENDGGLPCLPSLRCFFVKSQFELIRWFYLLGRGGGGGRIWPGRWIRLSDRDRTVGSRDAGGPFSPFPPLNRCGPTAHLSRKQRFHPRPRPSGAPPSLLVDSRGAGFFPRRRGFIRPHASGDHLVFKGAQNIFRWLLPRGVPFHRWESIIAQKFSFHFLDPLVKAGAVWRRWDFEQFSVQVVHEFVDQGVEKRFAGDDFPPDGGEVRDADRLVFQVIGPVFFVGEDAIAHPVGLVAFKDAQPHGGQAQALADRVQEPLAQGLALCGPLARHEPPREGPLLPRRLIGQAADAAGALEIGRILAPTQGKSRGGRRSRAGAEEAGGSPNSIANQGPLGRADFLTSPPGGC